MSFLNGDKTPPPKPVPKETVPEHKIIVIGDSSVGKTAIIHSYISGTFTQEKNITVGVAN